MNDEPKVLSRIKSIDGDTVICTGENCDRSCPKCNLKINEQLRLQNTKTMGTIYTFECIKCNERFYTKPCLGQLNITESVN